MNLLKKITVSGDIFYEYAYLSFEFYFENRNISMESQYTFRLPPNSCISNIMIGINRDNDSQIEIIQPKIVAATHLCGLKNLTDLACLTRLSDDTYSIKIASPVKKCRLVLNVYTPLGLFSEKQGLDIPLTISESSVPIKTNLDITVHGAAITEVFSPSHNILCRETERGTLIELNNISSSDDLEIEINARQRINSAIAATDGLRGEILCHIFPSDKFLAETDADKIKHTEVLSAFGKGMIIKYPEHINDSFDVIFELRGPRPQTEFQIRCGNTCETVRIEKFQIYNRFAPIRLLYAEKLCAELAQTLDSCRPDEVRTIKRKIEKIGIKYSVLNTETAFIADLGNSKYGLVRTDSAKPENISRFRDSRSDALAVITDRGLLNMYAHSLITLMHGDGAICLSDEYNAAERKLQTLLAVLALIAADMIDPNGEFVRAAKTYIGGAKIRGLGFTPNSGTAIVMLKSFIVSSPDTTVGSPEFYSAVKRLCNSNT